MERRDTMHERKREIKGERRVQHLRLERESAEREREEAQCSVSQCWKRMCAA